MRYFIDQNATHILHAHFKTAEMILSFNSDDLEDQNTSMAVSRGVCLK